MIGVLGGMGVRATALFYDMLLKKQCVEHEQDFKDVLIYSKSSIPDRTAFITGESEVSPLPDLLHGLAVLQHGGATCIAIPCITSHFFYADLARVSNVPVLNMLEETAKHIKASGISKVGLLATVGTIKGQFFHRALHEHQVNVLELADEDQARLMHLIYEIKANRLHSAVLPVAFAKGLYEQGAEAIVLGCTELSVVSQDNTYIDALEILAQAALSHED